MVQAPSTAPSLLRRRVSGQRGSLWVLVWQWLRARFSGLGRWKCSPWATAGAQETELGGEQARRPRRGGPGWGYGAQGLNRPGGGEKVGQTQRIIWGAGPSLAVRSPGFLTCLCSRPQGLTQVREPLGDPEPALRGEKLRPDRPQRPFHPGPVRAPRRPPNLTQQSGCPSQASGPDTRHFPLKPKVNKMVTSIDHIFITQNTGKELSRTT